MWVFTVHWSSVCESLLSDQHLQTGMSSKGTWQAPKPWDASILGSFTRRPCVRAERMCEFRGVRDNMIGDVALERNKGRLTVVQGCQRI